MTLEAITTQTDERLVREILVAAGPRGASSVLFCMVVYVVMTMGAFLCVLWMRDEEGRSVESIASLSGLAQTRPAFAAAAFFMPLSPAPHLPSLDLGLDTCEVSAPSETPSMASAVGGVFLRRSGRGHCLPFSPFSKRPLIGLHLICPLPAGLVMLPLHLPRGG